MTSRSDRSYLEHEFDVFCRRVSPRLVAALRLQTGNDAYAAELAQEALMRAWKRWEEVSAMESPEAWVFRVAHNLAASLGRRLSLAVRVDRRLRVEPGQADETLGVEVREVLAQLSSRRRQAVILRHLVEFSVRETAEIMGCAEGTVKSLTEQGLRQLRLALSADNVGDEPIEVSR